MPETRPYIPWDVITNFMKDAFMGYGVPERDAEICTDVLVESDRRGIESHGCNRFKPIYIDRIPEHPKKNAFMLSSDNVQGGNLAAQELLDCGAKPPQRLFMMLTTAWAWLRATA